MPSRRALAAVLVAAALLGGCGAAGSDSAESFKGEERAVAQTVEDLQDAGTKRDAQRMCDDLLATPVVRRLTEVGKAKKQDCAGALDESLDDADSFDLEILDKGIEITGSTATARVRSETGDTDRTDTLALVKEGRNWKLSEIR